MGLQEVSLCRGLNSLLLQFLFITLSLNLDHGNYEASLTAFQRPFTKHYLI